MDQPGGPAPDSYWSGLGCTSMVSLLLRRLEVPALDIQVLPSKRSSSIGRLKKVGPVLRCLCLYAWNMLVFPFLDQLFAFLVKTNTIPIAQNPGEVFWRITSGPAGDTLWPTLAIFGRSSGSFHPHS
jgi:hypothetical protein